MCYKKVAKITIHIVISSDKLEREKLFTNLNVIV